MNINDLLSKQPQEIIQVLANYMEEANKNDDIKGLHIAIECANQLDFNAGGVHFEAVINYFIGNAWSDIQRKKYPNGEFPIIAPEVENQIIHYRRAYDLIKKIDDDFNKCQILTNLGNLFSHIGRFSEAQEYLNLCLEIDAKFDMAIGNRGMALFFYGRVMFDPDQQFVCMKHARRDLLKSLESEHVYESAKLTFFDVIQRIEKAYLIEELDNFKEYEDYYKDLKRCEIDYRKWCAKNKLFINPLNDILTESIVACDSLFLPAMVLNYDEDPIYHNIFNQLKQEYVSARYLFYESFYQSKTHFSDKDVVLADTLDYAVFSFSSEKIKICFRVCYSIFDKIAYLLNNYLKLGHKPARVFFRSVWYDPKKKNRELIEDIHSTQNWAMRALFWLSKDFYEKDFEHTIEPEAKEIADIRNYMEHKSFKIIDGSEGWVKKAETFTIDRDLFYDKTFKLLKLTRSSLMYLSFLIHDEEEGRKKNFGDRPVIPIEFPLLNDDIKI